MCSDLDAWWLLLMLIGIQQMSYMCNELHYNAFRNNAVHIRQVREIPALQKMCSKNKRS